LEAKGKEEGTMSSREDQAQEAVVNGAEEEEEAASRIFALGPGEGEAWWWFGGLATIKATREQTGGRYTLVEILVRSSLLRRVCCTSITSKMRASTSSKAR
jgi:hypothetical protein